MQLVMVVILGGAIALAAAVGSRTRSKNRVELSAEPVTAKHVTVRLPQGWRTQPAGAGAAAGATDPGLVVEAVENVSSDGDPLDSDAARTITVRIERLPTPLSPVEFLLTNFEMPLAGPRQRRTPAEWLVMIPMAGHDDGGVMMTAERGSRRRGSTLHKEVVAVAVLPSLRAVSVHLQGMGEADAQDQAIVRQVAAAISISNEPEPGKPGDSVTLADGIRFTAPRRLAPVPQTDPNRTDRLLWPAIHFPPDARPEHIEHQWLAVETVGCLCPDFDASDPKQVDRAKATMTTLLLVRDFLWRGANVRSIGPRTWRADPAKAEPGANDIPMRAFLRTDPSGRALLVVIRGGLAQSDFDSPWNEIAPTIQFQPAADIASLEDIGTSEAARLRKAGYEKLLADRDVEWWLWTSNDALIGWSSIEFDAAAKGIAGKKQSHLRTPDGDRVSHVTHDFSWHDVGPRYTSTITRELTGAADAVKSVQKTTIDGGKLSRSFDFGGATTIWNPQPPPPQFVAGALLPLVLAQLGRDPMILQTDAFPGREGFGPPQPLTLIIRPGESGSSSSRCVTVQVNGAGSISRWYFRKTGELESVEWPGGIKQIASDQAVVKNNFPKESGMAPP